MPIMPKNAIMEHTIAGRTFTKRKNLVVFIFHFTHFYLSIFQYTRPCKECLITFTGSGKLKKQQSAHSGEKSYPCIQGPQIFSQPFHLKNHKRTDSGNKPFLCKQCPKTFSVAVDLKTYQRTHSG